MKRRITTIRVGVVLKRGGHRRDERAGDIDKREGDIDKREVGGRKRDT